MADYHIGTSGWSYSHWAGIFYPKDLDKRKWLSFYAEHFDSVEINSTFYRLPFQNMVKGWRNKAPDGFLFAVKGWRVITHKKRLKDVKEDIEAFMNRAGLLQEKLGVVLWQLPPSLKKDVPLLKEFLSLLPKNTKHTIEFRNSTWFDDQVYDVLKENDVALCITDSKRFRSPWVKTASFVYIRFHGPERLYASEYSEKALLDFAKKIKEMDAETFVYFNNDFEGFALKNAKFLREALCG